MTRIFNAYAYGPGPRSGCWWDETCDVPSAGELDITLSVDVAIVGGGFTGVSAALRLASKGVNVALLEAESIGWGASGRSGGFCCLGGSLAADHALDASYGRDARLAFRQAEKTAVDYVEHLISTHELDVERHSNGETELAHRPKDMAMLRMRALSMVENYGVEGTLIEQDALANCGMQGGPFYGALTVPIGFGLNPRKYLSGLVSAAQSAGVLMFAHSPATKVSVRNNRQVLTCPKGSIIADQVIFATNGYTSESLSPGLKGRYMPTQSTVLVTRPLTNAELFAQGWTTDRMCYDSRNLLHYFRLMPDRRFLFGMRGGLLTGPKAESVARLKVRKEFEKMFPTWNAVESSHSWSGMVSLARNKVPFVGQIPSMRGQWAAMCYHGNGVAMGSYAGRLVADMVLETDDNACPEIMKTPLARFPLGPARRALMPPIYAGLKWADIF